MRPSAQYPTLSHNKCSKLLTSAQAILRVAFSSTPDPTGHTHHQRHSQHVLVSVAISELSRCLIDSRDIGLVCPSRPVFFFDLMSYALGVMVSFFLVVSVVLSVVTTCTDFLKPLYRSSGYLECSSRSISQPEDVSMSHVMSNRAWLYMCCCSLCVS